MNNGEIFFIFKTILKLIFYSIRNILINEPYLINDLDEILSKIDSLENKDDLNEIKISLKNFFEIYSYFFKFNLHEERINLHNIINQLNNLSQDLILHAEKFKEKLKEFENEIDLISEKKDLQNSIASFKEILNDLVVFIDFTVNEILNLKDTIIESEKKILSFEKKLLDLRKKSFTDELTGVYNRRALKIKFNQLLNDFISGKSDFAVIMLDLNNFKMINDKYGHVVGDKILKLVAEILKKTVRDEDFICRYGGDEFLIIITNVKKAIASGIAKRIVEKIEKAKFIFNNEKIDVKVSCGLYYVEKSESIDEIISKADKAMYEAKQSKTSLKIFC